MKLTLAVLLFVIAAVIFFLDAIAGFAVNGWAYSGRAHGIAFGCLTVALLLSHKGS